MIYHISQPRFSIIAEPRARRIDHPQLAKLHAALAPYVDLVKLRDLAMQNADLYDALRSAQLDLIVNALLI